MRDVADMTITDAIVARLAKAGVRHVFGVPGGECNLDFIAACEDAGLTFVLNRTETAAAIMASVTAELTDTPGVVMTTRGPGLLSACNGVAYAALDRAPLVVIADGYDDAQSYISHQRIDQTAVLAPYVKAQSSLRGADPLDQFEALLEAATSQPPGPVYLEVAGSRIRGTAPPPASAAKAQVAQPDPEGVRKAQGMLARAARPIVVAGLQARSAPASAALREFVARTGCPVLTTYKAKGVVDETDPLTLGHYIGGVAERAAIEAADTIILYGFDPVEGPPQPWGYDLPLLELTEHVFDCPLVSPEVSVVGCIATTLEALGTGRFAWTASKLAELKHGIRVRASAGDRGKLSPQAVVEAARAAAPPQTRITVDAGAHMLPVLHLWTATERNRSLISRGLSTMGFALPAAVASALTEPDRPVIAFTGDGGLMMCLSEMGTAVQQGAAPIVVVFNDANLTLIGVKQMRRQFAAAGVDFSPTDFAEIARGFGWQAARAETAEEVQRAVAEGIASRKPTLVDAVIDPSGYREMIEALRG